MLTKPSAELTLFDTLSRLTFTRAAKLLGPQGNRLIATGGKFDIDLTTQVKFDRDLFRLTLDGAAVTLTLSPAARHRLEWRCDACEVPCEHAGAAFSLILEEKLALGLAGAPPARVPAESVSEEVLVAQALAERAERARTEKMRLTSLDSQEIWTDYTLTNAASGKSYRVALRGWQPGQSYCSCPDFRKNTLGTCKHILHALEKVRRRFSHSQRNRPYRRRDISVHLSYGEELELRILLPPHLDDVTSGIVRPIRDRPITDLPDLLKRIRQLEAHDVAVTVYPDAEEYIQIRLRLQRIAAKVAEIRRNPKSHPLRTTLLKVEILPYQLDGIAFAASSGRAILADDMGLGKTLQGIGMAELLAREADIRKVLVVCPASVKAQWRSEVLRFSGRDCQIVLGSAAGRSGQYENECFFTICNYEQVLRDIIAIERVRWDLIVLDEGQRIKNWEAKTAQTIKSLRSPFALVLSGTPLENRLDDLFSVVEFIDDRRLGPAFRFFNRHRVTDESGKILGYKDLNLLRQRLKPVLLRRTRSAVMKDLPPRTTEIVRIAPTDEQAGIELAQMQIVSAIVRKSYISEMDLLRLQKALLLARMNADSTFLVDKHAPGFSSKLERLQELLEELAAEDDRKIVLFSSYVYDAFGMPITTTGTTPNNFLYSGEQFDSALGIYYLRARYYNPATGRFLAMDPYAGYLIQPATLHKYVYAQNDPVDGVDPTGRDAIIEVAFMYARPGFGVLAQGRIQFDPEALLEKGWDIADAAQEVEGARENAGFASKVALCDSLTLINIAGVLGGVSNGGQNLSNLALSCFYNALREPLATPLGNPVPEIP
jgi:RHS repeat-associated protein